MNGIEVLSKLEDLLDSQTLSNKDILKKLIYDLPFSITFEEIADYSPKFKQKYDKKLKTILRKYKCNGMNIEFCLNQIKDIEEKYLLILFFKNKCITIQDNRLIIYT